MSGPARARVATRRSYRGTKVLAIRLADFIGRAGGPGWGLRVCAYEFTDDKVLTALGAARDRGADVQVLYHAENDPQKISNQKAIENFGLQNICQPRNAQGLTLSHNKT